MAGLLSALELELRIALLPPVSHASPFNAARLHAERLVELWKVDNGDHVPLAQGWRLLDVETVAGAISRTLVKDDGDDYPGDPCAGARPLEERLRELTRRPRTEQDASARLRARLWSSPGLQSLLSELYALTWQTMLDGILQVEAIEGVRGTCHRMVAPAELSRLMPDWTLSRLTFGGRDEFVGVQIRRASNVLVATEAADVAAFAGEQVAAGIMVAVEDADGAAFVDARSAKRPWGGEKPSAAKLRAAMEAIEQDYPPDAHPSEKEVWGKLEKHCGPVTRATVRSALEGSRLKGQRGYHSTKSPPT